MLRPGYISLPRTSLLGADRMYDKSATQTPLLPLMFPATRSVLWDHREIGQPTVLHLVQCRNPVVLLEETTLRLAQRLAQDSTGHECLFTLTGSINAEPDGGGITVTVDRLDTSKPLPTDPRIIWRDSVTGRITVPFLLAKDGVRSATAADDYVAALEMVDKRCRANKPIDLSHFVALRLGASCHRNQSSPTAVIFQLELGLVYPNIGFRATAVNALPIIPTALSKNLAGPMSISEVQGEAKSGYLSMDQTRKLLLVLESDPKVHSMPVVGIWIAGLSNIEDPFVWASSIRYVFNASLKDRVCLPPEPFLVVFFSLLHSKPEFYECVTANGQRHLDFDLVTCHDVVQLHRDNVSQVDCPVELELMATGPGEQLDAFQSALQLFRDQQSERQSAPPHKGCLADDTELPRAAPVRPHTAKEFPVSPSVPELTLLFDDSSMPRSAAASPIQNSRNPPAATAAGHPHRISPVHQPTAERPSYGGPPQSGVRTSYMQQQSQQPPSLQTLYEQAANPESDNSADKQTPCHCHCRPSTQTQALQQNLSPSTGFVSSVAPAGYVWNGGPQNLPEPPRNFFCMAGPNGGPMVFQNGGAYMQQGPSSSTAMHRASFPGAIQQGSFPNGGMPNRALSPPQMNPIGSRAAESLSNTQRVVSQTVPTSAAFHSPQPQNSMPELHPQFRDDVQPQLGHIFSASSGVRCRTPATGMQQQLNQQQSATQQYGQREPVRSRVRQTNGSSDAVLLQHPAHYVQSSGQIGPFSNATAGTYRTMRTSENNVQTFSGAIQTFDMQSVPASMPGTSVPQLRQQTWRQQAPVSDVQNQRAGVKSDQLRFVGGNNVESRSAAQINGVHAPAGYTPARQPLEYQSQRNLVSPTISHPQPQSYPSPPPQPSNVVPPACSSVQDCISRVVNMEKGSSRPASQCSGELVRERSGNRNELMMPGPSDDRRTSSGIAERNPDCWNNPMQSRPAEPPRMSIGQRNSNQVDRMQCRTPIGSSTTAVPGGRTTVTGLLSAMQAQNSDEWADEQHFSPETMLGHSSGSTDSGLQVNDSSSTSGETPQSSPPDLGQPRRDFLAGSGIDFSNLENSTVACRRDAERCNRNSDAGIGSCFPSEERRRSTKPDFQPKMCSVAVNTTLYWPQAYQDPEDGDRCATRRSTIDSGNGPDIQQPERDSGCMTDGQEFVGASSSVNCDNLRRVHDTCSPVSGPPCLSSTVKDILVEGSRQATWEDDDSSPGRTRSMAEVSVYTPPPPPVVPNPSEESVMSEMIMDMPEYSSLSPDKTELFGEFRNHCSHLASDTAFEQVDADDSWIPSRPDSPHNCRQQHVRPDQSDSFSVPAAENVDVRQANSSYCSDRSGSMKVADAVEQCKEKLLRVNLERRENSYNQQQQQQWQQQQQHVYDVVASGNSSFDETMMLDAAVLPKLNYVSMIWDRSMDDDRSPADTTSIVNAANAAAVKYLNDQQLVQQAAAAADRRRSNPSSRSAGLRTSAAPGGSSNASIYGMKSANLSLASRRYFEKHNLMGGKRAGSNESNNNDADGYHKSNVENLLSSITSQVNNLQTFASPEHGVPGRRHGAGNSNRSRISDGEALNASGLSDGGANRNGAGHSGRRHGNSSRHSLSGISRATVSDTTLDQNSYVDSPSIAGHRASLDSSVPHQRLRDGYLRAVDRTLEFADDVVVDNSLTPGSQWRS